MTAPFRSVLMLSAVTLASCAASERSEEPDRALVLSSLRAEAISLLGQPLQRPEIDAERLRQLKADLAEAAADYERDPHQEEHVIWYGRRLAYLGRYRDAINVYERGLARHPDSYRIRRHLGHRLITTRQLQRAIDVLARAATLAESATDRIEPDGQPNQANIPLSTDKFNIWYHLGLAHFLNGNFAAARQAYRECLSHSRNDDLRVATSHWLYMTLMRLDRHNEARQLLSEISPDMDIIENGSYHRLLLMYRGVIAPEALLESVEQEDLDRATVGFGVGHWLLMHDRTDEAHRLFEDIVRETGWAAFGHIAAEAELSRWDSLESQTPGGPREPLSALDRHQCVRPVSRPGRRRPAA